MVTPQDAPHPFVAEVLTPVVEEIIVPPVDEKTMPKNALHPVGEVVRPVAIESQVVRGPLSGQKLTLMEVAQPAAINPVGIPDPSDPSTIVILSSMPITTLCYGQTGTVAFEISGGNPPYTVTATPTSGTGTPVDRP